MAFAGHYHVWANSEGEQVKIVKGQDVVNLMGKTAPMSEDAIEKLIRLLHTSIVHLAPCVRSEIWMWSSRPIITWDTKDSNPRPLAPT
jgi:hypothetical protein